MLAAGERLLSVVIIPRLLCDNYCPRLLVCPVMVVGWLVGVLCMPAAVMVPDYQRAADVVVWCWVVLQAHTSSESCRLVCPSCSPCRHRLTLNTLKPTHSRYLTQVLCTHHAVWLVCLVCIPYCSTCVHTILYDWCVLYLYQTVRLMCLVYTPYSKTGVSFVHIVV